MKNPKHSFRILGFLLIFLPALLWANGDYYPPENEGLFFTPDSNLLGTRLCGSYKLVFDNREYSPLAIPSPEERTVFGQDVRLALLPTYEDMLTVKLGLRLWHSFGEPLDNAVTLAPDISAKLSLTDFYLVGGQFRVENLHPIVFSLDADALDLPGISLGWFSDFLNGEVFLARPQTPGDLRYETYAGGGQFWLGGQYLIEDLSNPPKDSLRLQWSGVHQAGFDTGGQDYEVPPGERKRESYTALLLGEAQLLDFLWLKPLVGGTLRRETAQSALFYGLETDIGVGWGLSSFLFSLRGLAMQNGFSSFWARDEYAVLVPTETALSSEDPTDRLRFIWGANISFSVPLSFGRFYTSIDECFRFIDEPFGEKEWDRNQVKIGMDIRL